MKKKIVSLLLVLVMCVTMLPIVSFAAGTMEVKVSADNTSPKSGDIVTFTVAIGAVADLTTMDFVIDVPAGMTYVENSATLQEGLKETLKVAAADWTELTKKFTMYGDSSYSSTGDTTIMTFKCKVDDGASGTLTVSVKELAASDSEYETIETTVTPATVTIPGAHTHVFDQKNTNAKYLASAATCTAKATYYYSCTCGEKGTATFESGETLPHTPSTEWSKDATHHWHVCTTCNAELNKEAHKPGPAATETTPKTCTVCGYEIAPVLPHEHNYTEQVATDEHKASSATCTAKATYYYSCKCGVNGTETFEYGEPLGHSWGQHVADKNLKSAADCENPAVYYVSCGRCDARDTENTFTYGEKLGHKGGAWQSDETGHWKVCERANCGKWFNEGTHDGGKATCQEKAKCEVCGAAYGKLGEHNFDTKWTSDGTHHYHKCLTAGCTEKKEGAEHSSTGDNIANCLHKAKCDVCKAEYGDLGAHDLTEVPAVPSTCRVNGTAAYDKCDVCGKMFDKDGKEITAPATLPLAAHTWDTTKWLANKDGHYRECKVCGIADTVITPHTPGAEATATTPQTCTDCGYIIKPATSHKEHTKGNLMSDATSHWYACTGCSEQLEKANHTVDKWTIDKEATTTEEGLRHGNCSVCQHVVYEKLAKINNTPTTPTKPGRRPSGTKTVQSGKTFDAGVGVYVGLSILSLTGSAVVIGKKRKTR